MHNWILLKSRVSRVMIIQTMFSARLQVRPVPSGSILTLVTVPSSTSMANLLHLDVIILILSQEISIISFVIPDAAKNSAQIQLKLKSLSEISTCISEHSYLQFKV